MDFCVIGLPQKCCAWATIYYCSFFCHYNCICHSTAKLVKQIYFAFALAKDLRGQINKLKLHFLKNELAPKNGLAPFEKGWSKLQFYFFGNKHREFAKYLQWPTAHEKQKKSPPTKANKRRAARYSREMPPQSTTKVHKHYSVAFRFVPFCLSLTRAMVTSQVLSVWKTKATLIHGPW